MSTPSNPLQQAVVKIVRDEIARMANVEGNAFNEQGVVIGTNDDGTVTVQTSSGVYNNCGTPVLRVQGEQVLLVTANGTKIAL